MIRGLPIPDLTGWEAKYMLTAEIGNRRENVTRVKMIRPVRWDFPFFQIFALRLKCKKGGHSQRLPIEHYYLSNLTY